MKLVYLALMALVFSACPATNNQIHETLEAAGFKNIQDEGAAIIGCGKDEIGSKFAADNALGVRVHGFVCCGGYTPLAKGCTIRFGSP